MKKILGLFGLAMVLMGLVKLIETVSGIARELGKRMDHKS